MSRQAAVQITQATTVAASAGTGSAARILQRKCACGNHVLGGTCAACEKQHADESANALGRRHPIQAKFVVNTPGDKYEREADWFAEHVMRLPDERPGPTRTPELRATDNDLHAAMTRTEPFEAAAESANMQIGPPGSGGTALDAPLRAFFEPRFGCDFARVRVHADASAAERNRAVR